MTMNMSRKRLRIERWGPGSLDFEGLNRPTTLHRNVLGCPGGWRVI